MYTPASWCNNLSGEFFLIKMLFMLGNFDLDSYLQWCVSDVQSPMMQSLSLLTPIVKQCHMIHHNLMKCHSLIQSAHYSWFWWIAKCFLRRLATFCVQMSSLLLEYKYIKICTFLSLKHNFLVFFRIKIKIFIDNTTTSVWNINIMLNDTMIIPLN